MFPPVRTTLIICGNLIYVCQVIGVPKVSAEDTTLVTTDHAGNKVIVPVPQGIELILHICGVHYNRK